MSTSRSRDSGGRPELFTGASIYSRAFEILVEAAAVALGTVALTRLPASAWPTHHSWLSTLGTAVIAGIAMLVGGLSVRASAGQKTFLNFGGVAALVIVLALPPRYAFPTAFIGTLISQVIRRRQGQRLTIPTIAFNQGQRVAGWGIAALVYTFVRTHAGVFPERMAVATAAAMYWLINTWVIATWNALRRRGATWDLWVRKVREIWPVYLVEYGAVVVTARISVAYPVLATSMLCAGMAAYQMAVRNSIKLQREHVAGLGRLIDLVEQFECPELGDHSERVAWWAERLARQLGMPEREADTIAIAGKLHDIGKVILKVSITADQASLDVAGRSHPVMASTVLMQFRGLESVARCLRWQTEWYNGFGYPDRLAGNAIPLGARIIAVADAYDLARCRYSDADDAGTEQSLAHIRRHTGTRFDPTVVAGLEALVGTGLAPTLATLKRALSFGPSHPGLAFSSPSGTGVAGEPPTVDVAASDAKSARPSLNRWARRYGDWAQLILDRDDVDPQVFRRVLRQTFDCVGRDLHDGVGALLTGLRYRLTTSSPPSGTVDADAVAAIDETLEVIRSLSRGLQSTALDGEGLAASLTRYADHYTSQTGVHVHLDHSGLNGSTNPAVDDAVYRIVQESLTNAVRHACTTEVNVSVAQDEGTVRVVIEDHGAGFDVEEARRLARGNGLASMRERAVELGGSLIITSRRGTGTRIEALLPVAGGPWTSTRP